MSSGLTPILFGLAATAATIAGGMAALRWSTRLWLPLGIGAGIVLGVAVLDLLPEAIALGAASGGIWPLMIALLVGFGAYMLLDQVLSGSSSRSAHWRKHVAPATLTMHSLIDGLGIGLAFQVNDRAGWLIALAVLTHDFADGVNTVGLSLAAAPDRRTALIWLVANGLAPLSGVLLGMQFQLPPTTLASILACFAGAFLYIGTCELIPRSRARKPGMPATAATLAGMALMAVLSYVT